MSIRHQNSADTTNPAVNRVPFTRVAEATGAGLAPQTISDRLGIAQKTAPPSWPSAFVPQYKEVEAVGNVVNLFEEFYGVEATGMRFFSNKVGPAGGAEAKRGNVVANLKAAKKKSSEAVLSTVSGGRMEMLAKAASDKATGLNKFDYKIYDEQEYTAILAVAKKDNGGTTASDKYNLKPFGKDTTYKEVRKIAKAQEARMHSNWSTNQNLKGSDVEELTKAIEGRNAACMGFAEVKKSTQSMERYGDAIYPKGAAAGVPTLVTLTKNDNNGANDMKPITGLVLEALDVKTLPFTDKSIAISDTQLNLTVSALTTLKDLDLTESALTTLKDLLGDEFKETTMSQNDFKLKYALCVHGLYVDVSDGEKNLHTGPKIIVPVQEYHHIAAFGSVTENGIESALAHAIVGKKLDLLLLWTSYRLVQGARMMSNKGFFGKDKKAAAQLFGKMFSKGNRNPIANNYDEDEFGDVNGANLSRQD